MFGAVQPCRQAYQSFCSSAGCYRQHGWNSPVRRRVCSLDCAAAWYQSWTWEGYYSCVSVALRTDDVFTVVSLECFGHLVEEDLKHNKTKILRQQIRCNSDDDEDDGVHVSDDDDDDSDGDG